VAGDLAGGHGGYPRQLLAVEQEQASGGAVGEVEGAVVQQAGGLCPAVVLAGGGAAAVGRAGDVERRAVPAGGCPGEEVADLAGAGAGCQPVVDVGLPALLQ
jgi:hypothetical protein